jgi:tRNA nucleotidyltransferase/poly(A) polymerase
VRPAAERTFAELGRLLEAPGTSRAARRLDELGLLEILLPEISALKGIIQNDYHHLDVFDHTLANAEALDTIINDPAAYFPEHGARLKERMNRQIAGDASWGLVMGLASLLHDSGKPGCQFTDTDGQVRFFEHDKHGAEIASRVMSRLKASADATRAVTFLVRKHMRFEGLLQQAPPSDRARLRYLRATEPFTPELIMLAVADRLSVRGRLVTDAAIEWHLAMSREMMKQHYAREEAAPLPKLVSGEDLMRELTVPPGPRLGELLDRIREEQELGRLTTREEALALASRLQTGKDQGSRPPRPGDD